MELDKIPAYQRARTRGAAIEDRLRSEAFLPIPETICGIEVVPLTLRIMLRLTAARSPFLLGGMPTAGQVVAFLWAVSPGYNLKSPRKKNEAKNELIEKAAKLPYRRALRGIRRYLYYAWMDRPPSGRVRRGSSPSVTMAAAICHHIAQAYGWDDEVILDKPLRRLTQYLNMIRLEGDPKAVTFNPIVDRLTKPIRTRLNDYCQNGHVEVKGES